MGRLQKYIQRQGTLDNLRFAYVKGLVKSYHRRGMSALDIGTSDGSFSSMIASVGYETTSFDIVTSPQIEANPVYKRIVAPCGAECYKFDAQFDLIHIGQVLEHINRPRDVLVNLAMYLSVGGVIILSVPNFQTKHKEHVCLYNRELSLALIDGIFDLVSIQELQVKHKIDYVMVAQ